MALNTVSVATFRWNTHCTLVCDFIKINLHMMLTIHDYILINHHNIPTMKIWFIDTFWISNLPLHLVVFQNVTFSVQGLYSNVFEVLQTYSGFMTWPCVLIVCMTTCYGKAWLVDTQCGKHLLQHVVVGVCHKVASPVIWHPKFTTEGMTV